ncbi:carbohydrate binding domain-containing protein [Chryseobacterium jejuense]|uniref:Por secretion system C-terminal sorting domain n=1 Tax=Chryseobacterium jejuense TaxID=445960 RepID=A0A2X2Z8K4_CHRJE|nr:carbohydrate binding domain-containing protein [Chryseobacterium jejuense]SDJ42873.1 Por secretion system C-terminal sorting domain-containing protein [Chryseobacterium jejuense]SQB46029.1 Por secretion system C-terminal sorting domain [Chryseobacterium jejuense]
MKKIYSLIALGLISGSMFAQNLVVNPTFDNGLTGWAAGTGNGYTLPNLVVADGNNGSNSAQYLNSTATNGFYQEIPVTGGQSYTISFWYKAAGDGTDARIWSTYKNAGGTIIYQEGTGNAVGNDPLRGPANGYLPTSSSWTQFTTTVVAPANVVTLQLAVRAYNNSTLVAYDDFSVVAAGSLATGEVAPSKYRLVKNTFVKNNEITFGADVKDVKVFNMFGQIVKQASVKQNGTVNVAELTKGNYIVTGTVNNQAVSQKILKD